MKKLLVLSLLSLALATAMPACKKKEPKKEKKTVKTTIDVDWQVEEDQKADDHSKF